MKKIVLLFLIFFYCINLQKISCEELSLEKAIEIALINNSDWKINQKIQENAIFQKKKSEAALFPAIGLSLNYSKTKKDTIASSASENYSNSLSLNQNIYNRKVRLLIDQAELSINQSKYNNIKVKHEIILNVKKAYYGILKLQARLDTHNEKLLRDKEQLKYAENLLNMGKAIKSEVLRAEITLEKTKQNLNTTRNELKSAKMTLSNILGVSIDNDFQYVSKDNLDNGIKKVIDEHFLLDEHVNKVTQNNYKLKIKNYAKEISSLNVKIAKTGHLPTVTGSSIYNWSNDKPDFKNKDWRVGVALSWTIFDAGLTNNSIRQAENEKDKVEEEKYKLEKEILLLIRRTYDELEDLRSSLQITKKSLELAEENYNIVKVQYQNGLVSNLNLIDAEVVYTEAKINLLDAFYNYKIKLAEWEDAIGEEL
ncbi:MAG: TolC family protein [Candidatus Firestonebacteria bacterium]|nr:TolC family protein [Candidatus Firestonebacteria bacterium]